MVAFSNPVRPLRRASAPGARPRRKASRTGNGIRASDHTGLPRGGAADVTSGLMAGLLRTAERYGVALAGGAFDLPLDWRGTAFQKAVWAALRNIDAGVTRS